VREKKGAQERKKGVRVGERKGKREQERERKEREGKRGREMST